MKRRTGLAAILAAHIVAAASCGYPTFQFNGSSTGGSGGTSTASSTASTGGGGATSAGGGGAGGTAVSSSTSTSTSSSGASCSIGHLVISEVRSRGLAGAYDEFVELYNPTDSDMVLDSGWTLDVRDASVTSLSYSTHWTGTGSTIAAHGHYLITGSGYAQSPAGDGKLSSITDASSLLLDLGGAPVDAVCYYYDTNGLLTLQNAILGYTCSGTPVFNPHDDTTGTNSDQSIERRPGGAAGNCTDTGDNASDFSISSPSTPESTTSPPAPG